MTIDELIDAARNGSIRAAGRLLSLVESPRRGEVLDALGAAPAPRVVGVTGPPGAGKSTTVGALVGAYRERDKRVAVLAVDPSSPYSGGALLGDRIRMAAHINDSDVLIRSVATRGHLGGLAAAVPAAIRLLAALSYDLVVLETVGVGQSEIEIAAIADPTIVLLNPGAGDAVQAAKAGLLEVADIVVINKADREGADQTVRDLRAETKAPILKLIAAEGQGIPELVEAIEVHHRADSPERRKARARAQILSLAQTRLRSHPDLDRLAGLVADGRFRSLLRDRAVVRRPGRPLTPDRRDVSRERQRRHRAVGVAQQRVVSAARDQPRVGVADVLVVVHARDDQVGAFGALTGLLNEPAAHGAIGIAPRRRRPRLTAAPGETRSSRRASR